LERALEMLRDPDAGVAEVAYKVGFGSPNYFSKCFQEQFGFSPSEVREKPGEGIPVEADPSEYPDQEVKKRKASLAWIISGLVVILVAVVYMTIVKPFSSSDRSRNMAIMVLPFHNDSPGEGDDYIINGLMDEILNKLTLMEELDVVSRTTSEKYRDSRKSSREIAREVRVNYILEGSGQTIFDTTRVRLQLIEPFRDRHLWAKPYEREIRLDNLFDVQEEVSRAVAEELKIVLNLREEELIEQTPTENLVAYEAYLQSTDLLLSAQYVTGTEQRDKLLVARTFLKSAILLDSSFVNAYTTMGSLCINDLFQSWINNNAEEAYSHLESGLVYVEKALQFDPGNSAALQLKGFYYQRTGNHEEANKFIEASFRNRIRTYRDYEWEAISYLEFDNFYPGLKSYFKYLELKPPDLEVPANLVDEVYRAFMGTGFFELARQQADKYLDLTRDYDRYYGKMSMLERWQGNHQAAQEYTIKRGELENSRRAYLRWSVTNSIYLNEFDSAYSYMQLMEAEFQKEGRDLPPDFAYGWIYLERGQKSEADYHLKGFISRQKKLVEMKTPNSQKGYTHLLLGIAYALLEDGPNTLKHLEHLKESSARDVGWIYDLEYLSCFDFVRNTVEFERVLRHMEKVNSRERKKIDRLLRKEDYPVS
jgi:TolB-like protein